MAEKRTDSARQESVDKVEVDDLDILATPEMIMLSAVSGEGAQDRLESIKFDKNIEIKNFIFKCLIFS